jgi:CBS domain-containing protein
MRAIDVMTTDVATVGPDVSIDGVVRCLIERGISGVPVVDDAGEVLGIVSEGDLIRRPELATDAGPSWWMYLLDTPEERARQYARTHGRTAKDVMTTPVWTVDEQASIAEIAELLGTRRIKRVPVVRDGRLVGIVSRANLLLAFGGTAGPGLPPR